jgi:carotenoid cleavage dioxygenase-like enzyme
MITLTIDNKGESKMGYPQTPDFMGLNQPVGKEASFERLAVEGEIPADVRGAFYRAVPDPAFPPKFDDDNVLSGDGMISKLHFHDDGSVDFAMKFVQTARHKAEVAAGRALFGRYRNPYTDEPQVAGVDRTVANTTPVWHAGKLLMTKEDGHAYRIDPHTLDTIGSYDFDGALKSETMTAHVRIDPVSGEMFFYGYECDGLASTKVAYCIADKQGKLVREQWFDVPYCSMMHDFVITENYALFPVYPTTADLERLKAGGEHWIHQLELESWVGVMPRYGDVSEIKWFKGPKGVSCYHMMNAHEDADGHLQFDQCLSSVNAFPFIQRASGLNIPPWEMKGGLTRWTINVNDGSDEVVENLIGPPGDFPVIPAAEQGRPYGRGWMLSMNPEMQGPPVFGGPVGAMFNMLLRWDLRGGPPQSLALPPAMCFNEPVHVPSSAAGHDGWLIVNVDTQTGPNDFSHAAWIIDAGNVSAGPVAKIAIPARQRPQVHGWWVSASALAAA